MRTSSGAKGESKRRMSSTVSVTVWAPKMSPVIRRACLAARMSETPEGRRASP